MTLAAWVRAPVVPGVVKSVVSQGVQTTCAFSSYSLYTGGGLDAPGIRFYIWNGVRTFVTPPAPNTMWDNAWHMVAGTFDGAAVRLYLDGLLVGSAPASGAIGYGLTSNAFVIGNSTPSGCSENTSFSGDVDEVMVFDRALSTAQVAALPAVPTPPAEPTPVSQRRPRLRSPRSPWPTATATASRTPRTRFRRATCRRSPGSACGRWRRRASCWSSSRTRAASCALKGAASLPVGAVVDARKGELTLTAASDARGRAASARLRAGIFRIRQARARGLATVSTDLVLVTPAGQSRACARRPPPKGLVRQLSVTAKGLFRTVAGAGVVRGANASWTVSDRCNGTLTQVRTGRVSVRAARATRTLRAGQRYLIKARLFAARRAS